MYSMALIRRLSQQQRPAWHLTSLLAPEVCPPSTPWPPPLIIFCAHRVGFLMFCSPAFGTARLGTTTCATQVVGVEECQLCTAQLLLADLCLEHGLTEEVQTKYDGLLTEFRVVCGSDATTAALLVGFGGPCMPPCCYYSAQNCSYKPIGASRGLVYDAMRTLSQCGFRIDSFNPLLRRASLRWIPRGLCAHSDGQGC